MSAGGGGGSQSAMTQCWDLHGDDRTRVPHLHVESGPSAETADDTRPDIPGPLVMPADEFAAVKAVAEACGSVSVAGAPASADTGRDSPSAHAKAQDRPGALPPAAREALGRLVRETWVRWAAEQPDPKPSWLAGWDELDGGQREVDMRIGEAVAAAERERLGVIPLSEALADEEAAGFRERFEAAMMNPGPLRVLPSDGWRERAEAAEAKLGELENAITWDTSCTSCARILDSAVAERERAERAEARLAVQREYDTYRRALWVMVRHFRGSVFLTSAQMEDVPLLASLGVGKEPGGIRINAGEEP